MIEVFYKSNYGHDNSRFGGVIYPLDFETDYREKDNNHGSPIAQRIMTDWRFDRQCKRNIEGKNHK